MTQTEMTRREARLREAAQRGDESPAVPEAPRTPQGWYADPTAPLQVRWWDGISWSEHTRPAPGAPSLPGTLPEQEEAPRFGNNGHSAAPTSMMGVPTAFRPAPAPLEWNTKSAWGLAFLPLYVIGAQVVVMLVAGATTGGSPAFRLSYFVVFLVSMATLISRDRAELVRRGYPKPANTLWGIFGPLGYLIARTVKVRRTVGHGSAPLWWYLGVSTVTIVVPLVLLFSSGVLQGFLSAAGTANAQATSTAEIEQTLQAELVAQGYTTLIVACPDLPQLSPGEVFGCTVTDPAQPAVPATITITIGADGFSYEASAEPVS